MSTAYAIVRTSVRRNAPPKVEILSVVWREADAVEHVRRLNVLGANSPTTHTWQATWVARAPDEGAGKVLAPDDREKLELARMHDLIDTERSVSVFFSFLFNRGGALAAREELRALGWPDAGIHEERTGDDCWHASSGSGRRIVLNDDAIAALRLEMEGIADRHGGVFDGWDISRAGGLRLLKPGELRT